MPDVENLYDITFDLKQNAIYVWPAAIKKLTDFSCEWMKMLLCA